MTKAIFTLREGMSFTEAMNVLKEAIEEHTKIEKDIHTNKHYELKNGRIWHKGNATGKYWELLCNSRIAQKQAKEILRI